VVGLEKIELRLLFNTINKRIEKLLDKDHQIGHSYFMSILSLDDLKFSFKNKIIPLLQEYFFGDYGKIGLVLGNGFFELMETNNDNIFANFDDYDASDFSERIIYKIKNISSMPDDDFISAINVLLKR
jgi:5-methylcytosine-specific restriction protein B